MSDNLTPAETIARARKSKRGLQHLKLEKHGRIYWNLPPEAYVEEALFRREGLLARNGPLLVRSGEHTARAANDKFIVQEETSRDDVSWGEYNVPYSEANFQGIFERLKTFLEEKDLFIQDGFAGATAAHRLPVRIITTHAWQGLFSQNMFITPETQAGYRELEPQFTVISVPEFKGDPVQDALNSETFILLNFKEKLVLIGNTAYGGEIKKSVFTAMNYYLPKKGVLSMHCSANVSAEGDSALFFGLSGTGKTTLSADPERKLIGDDEHGWDEEGIFNFEDGSYAKVIDLSQDDEPDIYACTHSFGTLLENVIHDPLTREIDLFDDTITRNTRASYPLDCIKYALPEKCGDHPRHIVFLTFDASGVMPPLARLSPNQALYHFISGYTSKVGGTEAGVGDQPEVTFSACFGAPFMVFHPAKYAELLKEKIDRHRVQTWLINTGLIGGPPGTGKRISIRYTRALLTAALNGSLDQVSCSRDPYFGFEVPDRCPGVPPEILQPKSLWEDGEAYDQQYRSLVAKFIENFRRYQDGVQDEVTAAGPTLK